MSTAPHDPKLDGRRMLIIGGSSGIGFAVASAAHIAGAIVTISSSSKTKVQESLKRLNTLTSTENQATGHACNLADLDVLEDNLNQLFRSVTTEGTNKLDHIVYTAGNKAGSVSLANINTSTITEHGILRFYAPIIIAKLAPAYINATHKSSITFTSGVNNVKPVNGRVLMAGWGAGVEGVTRAAAVDLKPVRVNCVCPGPTRTELFDSIPDHVLGPLLEKYQKAHLTGTIGTPEEVAEVYLYLMRDSFADGTIYHSNGGLLLG